MENEHLRDRASLLSQIELELKSAEDETDVVCSKQRLTLRVRQKIEDENVIMSVRGLKEHIVVQNKSASEAEEKLKEIRTECKSSNAKLHSRDRQLQEKDGLLNELQNQLAELLANQQRLQDEMVSRLASKDLEVEELSRRTLDLKGKLLAAIKKGKRIEQGKVEVEAQVRK